MVRQSSFLAACVAWFAACGTVQAQGPEPAGERSAAAPNTEQSSADTVRDTPSSAISGHPAAVNILTGTGRLGELLGLSKDSGLRLGGLWIGDASGTLAGGLQPGHWGLNSLGVIDFSLDTEKLGVWKGGSLGIDFLQFNGQPTNRYTGGLQGFDSIQGRPPLDRSELYELWYRQEFGDKLSIRVGKQVPTYDFNNVCMPVPVADESARIPSVTGVGFTPIFVNPTILGVMPGYYNSATGIATTFTPTKQLYINYGVYDGSLATGDQTGLMGPQFNGHYFNIAETGYAYRIGEQKKPGIVAVGMWHQTGALKAVDGSMVQGATGVYMFGSQRLWFRHPGIDNSGVSGYYQLGANNSNALIFRQYVGTGLTAFGLVPGRKDDSFGFGLAWAFLNQDPNAGAFFAPGLPGSKFRSNEMMLQWYYQASLRPGAYFQPAITYIPNPGIRPDTPGALAVTFRLTLLF
ncbi:MAG: carbohydrate porin [Gemmataceae bacterium]